ncbi:hypothetical protein JCM5353_006846 [Sporobolomyces roseus]
MELPIPPLLDSSSDAPTYRLNHQTLSQFSTLSYPSPISTSQSSLQAALSTLPSLPSLSKQLSQPSNQQPAIELNLSINNPYHHKVQASIQHSNNLVIRVTKRRRKVPLRNEKGEIVQEGQYRIEPVGIENKLIRFRAMADFQYIPSLPQQDPVLNLVDGIRSLDIAAIRQFTMPEPSESFPESSYIPPPIFTRHGLPQNFDLRPAGGAVRITTSSGLTRLVNSTRYKVKTMQSILFLHGSQVPLEPDAGFLKELGRTEKNRVEEKLELLLESRPVWTRVAMCNQLNGEENKFVNNNKSVWPMIGYTFGDGPFRDLVIKFGYDPRIDPNARFYQHFILRNINNVRSKALPGTKGASQAMAAKGKHGKYFTGTGNGNGEGNAGGEGDKSSNKSHIFDGDQVYAKIGNFQLVDIVDPLSRALIDSSEGVLESCSRDANEGWYAFDYLDQIKQVVRRKFMGLLQGVRVEDKDCDDLLGWELSRESREGKGTRGKSMGITKEKEKEKGGGGRRRRKGSSKSQSGSQSESSAVETEEGSGESGRDENDGEGSGQSASGQSEQEGDREGDGDGEGEGIGGTQGGRKKPKKPVRAPWEMPRKKKRRPKIAETEEDMLARLQRKSRRSTTTGPTGLPIPPARFSRPASEAMDEDQDQPDE